MLLQSPTHLARSVGRAARINEMLCLSLFRHARAGGHPAIDEFVENTVTLDPRLREDDGGFKATKRDLSK